VPADHIIYLAQATDRDPRVTGRSTREGIEQAFGRLADATAPGDTVLIVLFGHGSFDGRSGALNLPGPDLSAADWARQLARLSAARVVFVNTASSSGAFLEPLAGPGRAVITATATGGERNDTRFPQFFVVALSAEAADQNHDGRISVHEAFAYAKARVEEAYKKEGLLLTEHAALQDPGALADVAAIGGRAPDAALTVEAAGDPALRALVDEQRALEQQIAALKLVKDTTPPQAYEAKMEELLTALALKSREIAEKRVKK
jgi:hypothetical protein